MPAENKDAQQTRRRLDDATAARSLSVNHKFRIPKLKVGTIDTLIALSDDLAKLDTSMNALVKKIKRTFDDTRKAEPSKVRPEERVLLANHSADYNADELSAAAVPQSLMIGEALGADPHGANQAKTPREAFFKFRWNRYVFNESDSIDTIRLKVVDDFAKSDEELRRLLSEFNEIKGLVTAQERKENGSILVRPISRFLRPEVVVETPHLTTVFLAVPKLKEQEFLASYMLVEQWAAEKAQAERERHAEAEARERARKAEMDKAMGTVAAPAAAAASPAATAPAPAAAAKAVDRNGNKKSSANVPTSTVVPGSAIKVVGEEQVPGDEFVLYRVVLFKRPDAAVGDSASSSNARDRDEHSGAQSTANVEKFKAICRDHRWTVRPFKFDAHEDERNRLIMAELVNKRRARWEHLLLWCESQFEEAFVAWTHVVAMRVYVEAVLRYGLSTEWIAALLLPEKGSEKKLRDVLNNLYSGLANSSLLAGSKADADIDLATMGGGQEYYPYVYVATDLTDL
mgnify:CR=1 FL=1